ncbi:MAG: HNH endonuclease [Prevotellaceae bacterium]|jgi:hypothetical protein|nr:HNH endonuclease [Prevotellaceae bacterium]
MEKAKLNNITLDEEDAALFNLKDDFLLKAKAIKYSILPKLNVLLEETVSRIRKIYGIEVFSENSIVHSAPNFREKRRSDLKIDYNYAFWGLGGSRLPIWDGLKRVDNKPTKIIPHIIGYQFSNNGLMLVFHNSKYKLKFTEKTCEIYLNFLLENMEYIQTIQSFSKMLPLLTNFRESESIIKPFSEILKSCKKDKFYDIPFIRKVKFPLDYNSFNSIINSFVIFFPIYYSLLEIARSKKSPLKELVTKINHNNLYYNYQDVENKKPQTTDEKILLNIDKSKFVKAGVRWQVFERDDFKCIACGKSAHDGAILHVDHIIPISKGGSNTMDNYQTLCHLCNIGKSNKSKKNLRYN